MPARRDQQTKLRTKLARRRVAAGLTQQQMAEATGIPFSSYVKLERGNNRNPPLGYLANCAIVLRLSVEELLDPEAIEWHPFKRLTQPNEQWLDEHLGGTGPQR